MVPKFRKDFGEGLANSPDYKNWIPVDLWNLAFLFSCLYECMKWGRGTRGGERKQARGWRNNECLWPFTPLLSQETIVNNQAFYMIHLGESCGIIPVNQPHQGWQTMHMHEKGFLLNDKTCSDPLICLGIISSHLRTYWNIGGLWIEIVEMFYMSCAWSQHRS